MTQSFTKTRTEAQYVCGFLFAPQWNQVALIHKTRPEWQKGKYNGVGGKIEVLDTTTDANQVYRTFRPETPHEAMVREFEEETGVRVENWDYFCTVKDAVHSGVIHFFRATTDRLWEFRKDTDEPVKWVGMEFLGPGNNTLNIISNLTWLIPLALDPNLGNDRISNTELTR